MASVAPEVKTTSRERAPNNGHLLAGFFDGDACAQSFGMDARRITSGITQPRQHRLVRSSAQR